MNFNLKCQVKNLDNNWIEIMTHENRESAVRIACYLAVKEMGSDIAKLSWFARNILSSSNSATLPAAHPSFRKAA